jgi:hypothetical protein
MALIKVNHWSNFDLELLSFLHISKDEREQDNKTQDNQEVEEERRKYKQ